MIQLLSDKDFTALGAYDSPVRVQEMYIDTDVFYKMFYTFHQLGLGDYITFEVDHNGTGVYVRIVYKEVAAIE